MKFKRGNSKRKGSSDGDAHSAASADDSSSAPAAGSLVAPAVAATMRKQPSSQQKGVPPYMRGYQSMDADEERRYREMLGRKVEMVRYAYKKPKVSDQFYVDFDTFQIVWTKGTAELMYVNEVRVGKHALRTKGFALSAENTKDLPEDRALVILHGTEFRLKQLCLIASSEVVRDTWAKGIWHFSRMISPSLYSTPLMLERWLETTWQEVVGGHDTNMTLKEARAFATKANIRLSKEELKGFLNAVSSGQEKVERGKFRQFYEEVMGHKALETNFEKFSHSRLRVSITELQSFFKKEQKQLLSTEDALAIIRAYGDPKAESLTIRQFIAFLHSSDNDLLNPREQRVHQNMTQSLSFYYINSSHNTYLMGDQLRSESSVEAYVRCLRQGCRCVEIDTWDGNNEPIVFHGHTLTSKIKFADVIQSIQEHAFFASDYPVILSIEQHCNLENQRRMADLFKETFDQNLQTSWLANYGKDAKKYPSPELLKLKIIIKHKKLNSSADGEVESNRNDMEDVSSSRANGNILIQNSMGIWTKHYFVLTDNKLFYSQATDDDEDQDEEEEEEPQPEAGQGDADFDRVELHFNEPWFHGSVGTEHESARSVCERRLREFNGPDGSFIVRRGESFKGEYTLSFWQQGKPEHCRIRRGKDPETGEVRYFMTSTQSFATLYDLVEYHKVEPLRSEFFTVKLTEPVPAPPPHEREPWFHKNTSRIDAEDMLKCVREDGAFLVRSGPPSSARSAQEDEDHFAVSFRAEGKIRHCRILKDGRLFLIGDAEFESLNELVNYYRKNPLYRKMKLRFPVDKQFLDEHGQEPEEDIYTSEELYQQPNPMGMGAAGSNLAVKALYSYRAERPDELSFPKHAIIVNVQKGDQDNDWWQGTYNRQTGFFPPNYVEEIDLESFINEEKGDDENPLGAMEKDSIILQDIGARIGEAEGDQKHILEVFHTRTNDVRLRASVVDAEIPEQRLDELVELINRLAKDLSSKRVNSKMRGKVKVASEMSDLVCYCQGVKFPGFQSKNRPYYHMSSFQERKAMAIVKVTEPTEARRFCDYNVVQLSRVYPNGKRVDSSNYDPQVLWNCGCQMVALNFQTPDKHMWLNYGKFLANGMCGYVLKPPLLCQPNFNPFSTPDKAREMKLTVRVISGRHLVKATKGTASPFVEVDVPGLESNKLKTPTETQNGLRPVWDFPMTFNINYPDVACLRFAVQDEDVFGDANIIGQAVYPLGNMDSLSIRRGYRSVQLRNAYNEPLGLGSLLVHVAVDKVDKMYDSSEKQRKELRRLYAERGEIIRALMISKRNNVEDAAAQERLRKINEELQELESELFQLEAGGGKKKKSKKDKSKK